MPAAYTTKGQAMFHFEDTSKSFLDECRTLAYALAIKNGEVSTDDIREKLTPPTGVSPKIYGAVFKGKDWELVRYEKTRIPTSHSRVISVWKIRTQKMFDGGLF